MDLDSVRCVADASTAAILINNPSDPCGAACDHENTLNMW